MNTWLIVAIIAGLMMVAGIAMVNALANNTYKEQQFISCETCGNSCTLESNCGLSTCGAVSGAGCGCRG